MVRNPARKQSPLLRRGGRLPARNPRRRASGSESRHASKSIAGSYRQHRPIYSGGITASGLTIIGYELRLSSLGRFVPVKLAQQQFSFVQFFESFLATLHALQALIHLRDKLLVRPIICTRQLLDFAAQLLRTTSHSFLCQEGNVVTPIFLNSDFRTERKEF